MRNLRNAFKSGMILIISFPAFATAETLFTYTGNGLPTENVWYLVSSYYEYESLGASTENGILHIEDQNTYHGSIIQYTREWQVDSNYINIAEFKIRVVSCSGFGGIYFGTSDGNYNMRYTLYPDRIESAYNDQTGETYYFDTAGQFNTYRLVLDSGIAKLYINETLALQQLAGEGVVNVNGIEFGAGSSSGTGEAYFDYVTAYSQSEIESKPEIKVNDGFINFSVTNGSVPSDSYCSDSTHYGRTVVDEINSLLYICTTAGWVSK